MIVLITGGRGDIALATKELLEDDFLVLNPGKNELDVSSVLSVQEYFLKIKDSYERIDILVNNAGYIKPELIKNSNPVEWVKHLEVNLMGTYFCTMASIRLGARKIINIASTAGARGRAEWSAYCASKAGVINFSESLVDEGYDVDCLNIGRTNTKMRNRLFPDEDKETLATPRSVAMKIYNLARDYYEKNNFTN